MVLTLVLAEAEVERIPGEIRGHGAVEATARRAKKPAGKILLDTSLHHDAMRDLTEGDRRGRPDILHLALLLSLDSPLNRKGLLRVLVHTRHDELMRVDPATRLVRNYPRFVGLLEQLFDKGRVPPRRDPPLLSIEAGWPLARVLEEDGRGPVVVLDPAGTPRSPAAVAATVAAGEDLTIVVGAFPRGGFHVPVADLATDVVALGDEELMGWTVVSELLVHREVVEGLLVPGA